FGPVELGIDLGVEGVAVALQVARGGEVGVNREGLALGAAASDDEQGDEEEGEDGAKGVHGDEWRGLGPALSGATPEGEGGAGGEVDGQDRTGQGGGGKGAVVDHGHGVVKAGLGHGGEV